MHPWYIQYLLCWLIGAFQSSASWRTGWSAGLCGVGELNKPSHIRPVREKSFWLIEGMNWEGWCRNFTGLSLTNAVQSLEYVRDRMRKRAVQLSQNMTRISAPAAQCNLIHHSLGQQELFGWTTAALDTINTNSINTINTRTTNNY